MKLTIINGPNLNLLGKREPEIYGNLSFEEYLDDLKRHYDEDVKIGFFQSNHEGEIIDKIHSLMGNTDGLIMNAGAYTHTSIAIADAIKATNLKLIEVHISNIYAREDFRKNSYTAKNAIGVITGLGLKGYELAIQYFLSMNKL